MRFVKRIDASWVEQASVGDRPATPPVEAARVALRAALADAPSVDLTRIDPPPTREPWSLQLDKLQLLGSLVAHVRPRHVLELGAGVSTRVLAWAGAEADSGCRISSVDNDPDSIRVAAERLSAQSVQCPVRFQFAPLVIRSYAGEDVPAYLLHRSRLASRRPVDMVLVDGPPAPLGGREGTLYQVMELTRPGTLLLLDDAERPEERQILRNWEAALGDAIEILTLAGPSGEMAAIVVHEPVVREELWPRRVRMAAAEIAETVPEGERFVFVDDDAWGDEFWAGEVAAARRPVPFLERNGRYWGPPEDDETAIRELERLRLAGAHFIAFAWPAFWWLDHYSGFAERLGSEGEQIRANDRVIVFALRQG